MFIIGVIVSGAVVVVLLFGGPASPQRRGIEDLLQALEASGGERSAGVLLPREKELWQTALELSLRLEKKEQELTPEELVTTVARLARMVQVDLAFLDRISAFDDQLENQRAVRSNRFRFLLHALGRTEREEAVGPLIDVVRSGREPYVAVAIQQLGNLHTLLSVRRAIEPIREVLQSPSSVEARLTACTVLSVLATDADQPVLDTLSTLALSTDGEIAWSAALALARLGSTAGKSVLLELLDRSFWESGERYEVVDEKGNTRRYPMPPNRVERLLIAAIEAARNLDDGDLWDMIDRLQSDPLSSVRGAATEACARRADRSASRSLGRD
jgi:HEAT repeat protein